MKTKIAPEKLYSFLKRLQIINTEITVKKMAVISGYTESEIRETLGEAAYYDQNSYIEKNELIESHNKYIDNQDVHGDDFLERFEENNKKLDKNPTGKKKEKWEIRDEELKKEAEEKGIVVNRNEVNTEYKKRIKEIKKSIEEDPILVSKRGEKESRFDRVPEDFGEYETLSTSELLNNLESTMANCIAIEQDYIKVIRDNQMANIEPTIHEVAITEKILEGTIKRIDVIKGKNKGADGDIQKILMEIDGDSKDLIEDANVDTSGVDVNKI